MYRLKESTHSENALNKLPAVRLVRADHRGRASRALVVRMPSHRRLRETIQRPPQHVRSTSQGCIRPSVCRGCYPRGVLHEGGE